MDPLSQGVVGAVLAQSAAPKSHTRIATLVGAVAGMMADLDILIHSSTDPLLNLEYHRHFTHSLIFIPVGALVATFLFYPLLRRRAGFCTLYLYAFLGYATAGLLDACTGYGTRLLWPFSETRVAWNCIGIIDPLFTLTLVFLAGVGFWKRRADVGRLACVFALLYLMLGVVQRERATMVAIDLATERGHRIERITLRPTVLNLVLWRSIYFSQGNYYMDAVRVGVESKVYPGVSVSAFDVEAKMQSLPAESGLRRDLGRFAHFSDGYLIRKPGEREVIADARYSTLPNSAEPLWGIRIDENDPDYPVSFEHFRELSRNRAGMFFRMLLGQSLRLPLPESTTTAEQTEAASN